MLSYFLKVLRGGAPHRAFQFGLLAGVVLFSGVVELGALGALALFVASLTSLDAVLSSRYVLLVNSLFGLTFLDSPRQFYLALGTLTVALVVFKNILTAVHTHLSARFEGALMRDYGLRMLRAYLGAPYEASASWKPADVVQLVEWRVFVGIFSSSVVTILNDLVVSLLLVLALFLLEPLVTLCVVLVLGIIGVTAYRLIRNRIVVLGTEQVRLSLAITGVTTRSSQGLKDVQLFGAAKEQLRVLGGNAAEYGRVLGVQRVYERATVWILETVGMGGLVLGSVIMTQAGDVSSARMMGTLSLLAVSAWRILPGMYRSVSALGNVKGIMPRLQEVEDFLKTMEQDQEQPAAAGQDMPVLSDSLVFRDLSFRYRGAAAQALDRVSFELPKGQMVGIIGHSGAGKSTLADILAGLLEPTGGEFLVDGESLRGGRLRGWRSQVGIVPQRPYLFDGTLAENVAFAQNPDEIDRDRVLSCCRQAGLREFVASQAEGLDTRIGERGDFLSGGQAQRVAIARALYRDPGLLIFDEATSSLDDATERIVSETIASLRGDRTIVIIAHRLQTVRDCDSLIWLGQGKVIDTGSVSDILSRYTNGQQ